MSTPVPICTPSPSKKHVRDWRGTGRCDHFVQFYRTDDYLIECLAEFVADGLWKGENTVVIATPEHRMMLEARLRSKGVSVASSMLEGQFLAFDADEMLAKFMEKGRPKRDAFMETIGGLVARARTSGRPLRAFGEMVALLWLQGNRRAAIELEQLWNELGRVEEFALFCAYPAAGLEGNEDGLHLEHICAPHSRVISLTP